jgi:superfamily II DNA helicase RecQ
VKTTTLSIITTNANLRDSTRVMELAASDYPYPEVLRFSSPVFDVQPIAPNTADNTASNDAEYLDDRSLNESLQLLYERICIQLRDGQKWALSGLHRGIDILLIAKTGFGKSLIFTGFHFLLPASRRAITLIISPLMAIEQDQALDLQRLFGNTCLPLVVDGKNNTPEVRHSIIIGNYTHIWVSAEIALGELVPGKSEKRKQTRRRITVYDKSGYRDTGSFTSVLQNNSFLDRLHLIAIDELHLCAKDNWGGNFRPALGCLHLLRQQCKAHTRLFGTTATLTSKAWTEVKISAGFRPETEVLRTSIYRNDVYLYMLPTDNPKSVFKRILLKALNEAPSRGGLVPKIIFFVSWITDVMTLKEDIGRWLREYGYPDRIVKSFHGDLSPQSKKDIQARYASPVSYNTLLLNGFSFNKGEISILCCTIAFAIGVNPNAVKYVVVRDKALPEPDTILQKLGRAARHGLIGDEKAVFFWLPEQKVVGLRDCDLDPVQRLISRRRRNSRNLLPGMGLMDTSASETDSNKRQSRTKKRVKPEQWRGDMKPEEYKMYNPPNDDRHKGCYWSTLLAIFEETITLPCYNCSACAPNLVCLPELTAYEQEYSEDPKIVNYLKQRLTDLAIELGSRPKSYWLEQCEPIVSERVLSKVYRDDFAKNYFRVLRGNLGDWSWKKEYGQEVIEFIRTASAAPYNVSQLTQCLSNPTPTTSFTPLSLFPTMSSSISHTSRQPLADITNTSIQTTSRGTVRKSHQKKKKRLSLPESEIRKSL